MRYIIYKITNLINQRYYIGRHSTNNINDNYMGSGKAIKNAIKKYGTENFVKEIIAESFSASDLWELEKLIVDDNVVKDPLSYNMSYGGKSYLDGLKKYDLEKFKEHQSKAGKIGGNNFYHLHSSEEQIKKWHSLGGKAAHEKNKKEKTHPFYNGTAAVMGGKAMKGLIELWNPNSIATNKNQKEYKMGDCKRVRPDTEKYYNLLSEGWKLIEDHKRIVNGTV